MKHIGIRVWGPPSINELLYFDEIVILHNDLSQNFGVPMTPDDLSRIDFLAQKGVLVDPYSALSTPDTASILAKNVTMVQERLHKAHDILCAPTTEHATADHASDTGNAPLDEHEARMNLLRTLHAEVERVLALPYRLAFEAHSEYQPTTLFNLFPTSAGSNAESTVLDVIIKRFPLPTSDVSLEAILDFRADKDAMLALRRLRRWATKCASDQVSPKELEEEIQDLVDKYTEYMNLHRMKYECGVLRTFVSTTLELAENLMRLRVKAAFETLFTLRTNSLALTEAELKAPGREVAYLTLAKEKLVR
jgi:hypothetical protein